MKIRLLLIVFLLPLALLAQTNTFTGTIVDEITGKPSANLTVSLVAGDATFTGTTNEKGEFSIDVPAGNYRLDVKNGNQTYALGKFEVNQPTVNVGSLYYSAAVDEETKTDIDNIPTVTLSDDDIKGGSSQGVSSALNASRDPFLATASFVFSNARFKIRGYDFENFSLYMNGAPVNDLDDGGASWGQWGGLNNVMYNRDNSLGLKPTTFAYTGIGGGYSLDTRASKQRKQLQVSYATTNRSYRHRLMATYNTGIIKKGWAVSVSASRRWADEGYVAGTFYNSTSYFLSVEKLFGSKHSLAFTTFGFHSWVKIKYGLCESPTLALRFLPF